jgi:Kef-type K+ transport system membrane component KefB
MLSIIPSLGSENEGASLGWVIGRPILAAVAMVIVLPSVFFYGLQAISHPLSKWSTVLEKHNMANFISISLLTGFVSVANYAGTSMLLGAFLSGLCLSFCRQLPAKAAFHSQVKPIQQTLLEPLFFASVRPAPNIQT